MTRWLWSLVALVIPSLTLGAGPVSVTWTGLGDGVSWNNAANWSSAPSLPGLDDDVVIGPGATAVRLADASVRSLSLARNLVFEPGGIGLQIGGDLILANNATVSGGTQGGAVRLRFTTAGARQIGGAGRIFADSASSSGSITVTQGVDLAIGVGIEIEGSGGRSMIISMIPGVGTRVVNRGTLRASNSGSALSVIGTTQMFNQYPVFVNEGLVVSAGAANVFFSSIAWSNTGTLRSSAGNFQLGGTFSDFGLVQRNGGQLTVQGAAMTPVQGVQINSAMGQVRFFGGSVNGGRLVVTGDGSMQCLSNTAWTGVRIEGAATFGEAANLTDCTLTGPVYAGVGTYTRCRFEGGAAFGGTATINACSFGGASFTSLAGTMLNVTGGMTLLNGGTLTLAANSASLNFGQLQTAQTIAGNGEIVMGTTQTTVSTSLRINGPLTIEPGVTLRARGQNNVLVWQTSVPSTRMINRGTIVVEELRNLAAQTGSANSIVNEGLIEVKSRATVSDMTVFNSGEIILGPGSNWNLASLFSMQTATLTEQIGGPPNVSLNVPRISPGQQGLTLGGRLRVQFVNGYQPSGCLAASLLAGFSTTPTGTGFFEQFDSLDLPAPSGARRGRVWYTGGSIQFSYSNAIDLVGLGGGGFADGRVTMDDLIAFLSRYFAGDRLADLTGPGGGSGPDGLLTADDMVLAVTDFFVGCP
ncbi:MAG: GC-type dockerin domain-anchored protein [Phycisphaerales bacterium]